MWLGQHFSGYSAAMYIRLDRFVALKTATVSSPFLHVVANLYAYITLHGMSSNVHHCRHGPLAIGYPTALKATPQHTTMSHEDPMNMTYG